MLLIENLEREREIRATYESMRHLIETLPLTRGVSTRVMLDVGSGEGVMALLMAEGLGAKKLILSDVENKLVVQLPPHAEFQLVDVCSPGFLTRFQNKASIITCFLAFHEFSDPWQAAGNLIRALPEGGATLIFDPSPLGWACMGKKMRTEGGQRAQHHAEDLVRIKRSGFDTEVGIRTFWEQGVFPRVPGETFLRFMGEVYVVAYFARQWGEVKQPSPEVLRELQRLGYLK